jgi:hypothetical protein
MPRRHGNEHHPLARFAPVLVCVLLPLIAPAAEVPLYQAQVPLAGKTEADRSAGFAQALAAVAVRASGRREAASNVTITGADPTRYVQRYSTSADGKLAVGFDARAISSLLAQAGLPYWAAERPLTMIEAPGADRAEGDGVAQWRGLPVQWSDAALSAQTSSGRATLRGVRSAAGYDWTFSHAGQTVQGRGSVTDGINLAADTLAARYAPPSTRGTSTVALRIAGIGDLRAYAGLLSYLSELSIVRTASVEALDGELLLISVTMRGDRQLLGRFAAMEGRLASGNDDPSESDRSADFVYLP